MKDLLVGCGCLFAVLSAWGGSEFPYGLDGSLAERHRLGNLRFASIETPTLVPTVNGGMPSTDSIATVFSGELEIYASEPSIWEQERIAVGDNVQAALALKCENGENVWMGFSSEGWIPLEGVEAEEGMHDVKIDIDYSLGKGNRKVRYSILHGGGFVALRPAGGSNEWVSIGVDDDKVSKISLYGVGEAAEVVAESGSRQIDGTGSGVVVDCRMNYDALVFDVDVAETWGVSGARVLLRSADEPMTTTTREGIVRDGKVVIDFSDIVRPGGTYSYEVQLIGEYNGGALSTRIEKDEAALYASVDWFGFASGEFIHAVGENVAIDPDLSFRAASDSSMGQVRPTSEASAGSLTIVTAALDVGGAHRLNDLPVPDAVQWGLTMARQDDGSRSWACLSGSSWLAVSGVGIGTGNGKYEIKVELDYRENPKVAYSVLADGEYVRLQNDGTEWFDLPSGKERLSNLAVLGGNVCSLNAGFVTTQAIPADVNETEKSIHLKANSEIDLAKDELQAGENYAIVSSEDKRFYLRWKDDRRGGGRHAAIVNDRLEVFQGLPANGLESYHSYVLGLDMTKESDRPAAVVKPGEMQSGDGVTVHVPNVRKENLPNSGVEVFFQRQRSMDQGLTWVDDGAPVEVGGTLKIPFQDNVLYRINTVVK